MLDFVTVKVAERTKKSLSVYPDFTMSRKVKDLMVRGGSFYAVWDAEAGLWSKSLERLVELVDNEVNEQMPAISKELEGVSLTPKYMKYASSGVTHQFTKFLREWPDNWHALDQKPMFGDATIKRSNYASFKLPYSLDPSENGIEQYDHMMNVLYSPEERQKIEWGIGCCLAGDAAKVQKFIALYGGPGTGKSTVLHIIEQLLEGYTAPFNAASLGVRTNQFALDVFASDPVVVIQHDADMSKIDDNTKFNSVVSHEAMMVNEKYAKPYSKVINSFIFIGTNTPIKITEARSGLGRRLIDVTPTGKKLSRGEYDSAMASVPYALGAIAHRCIAVYKKLGRTYYDGYRPMKMFGLTNDVYSFLEDNYGIFSSQNQITMTQIWKMYNEWAEDANLKYKMKRRELLNELQYYFNSYEQQARLDDGTHGRSVYSEFKKELFDSSFDTSSTEEASLPDFLKLKHQHSVFDDLAKDYPAQYANEEGTPSYKWSNVKTKLKDISTEELHYVKVPSNHIVIDFDLTDDSGKKSLERNLEAASKWPATYAETSKSGSGLHLHYIYNGDVSELSRVYSDNVEIKVFTGNSALRRKLILCNDWKVATLSSGLPLKEKGGKMVNFEGFANEKAIRTAIKKNLNKEYHPGTKPSVDYIYKILEDAYNQGMKYDVTDMQNAVIAFSAASTHHADYCLKLVNKMHFKSEEAETSITADDPTLIFYDVEVFPNLFLINWKVEGEGMPVIRMINPTPQAVEELATHNLVGFNCRRYDNHILYAAMMGFNNAQLYSQSQKIINGSQGAFFGDAYNLSYTDVYDFCSKKQSLKKWEIELGIHHQELGLPWDQPVPEDQWLKVAEYCDNDVIATEAVFNARKADFVAREILADIAEMTVNDTTNSLSTRIIFGKNRKPQDRFNYRNLAEPVDGGFSYMDIPNGPVSGKPYFPGYTFEYNEKTKHFVSTYRGIEVGEGGFVYSEPGIHRNVALLDVASMHPSSMIAEELFGEEYTQRFADLKQARIYIKHGKLDEVRKMFDGKLAKWLTDESMCDALAQALKIVINSVYGLTAAKFDNPFRDIRNRDNIVAKRGALFMVDLLNAVREKGFTVAHIKTDSIKIPDATPEIIEYVMAFGEAYGYSFEHEATYEKMCLVNDAVYVAKYASKEACQNLYNYIPDKNNKKAGKWDATGTQFQVPYVFKTLFSHDPIVFEDKCETKSVTSALYLDMNEDLGEGEHDYRFVGKVGEFCPIKPGCGGGQLFREKDGKYYAATGTTGYRWLESETVRTLGKEEDIDISYYTKLVDAAADSISAYGDFDEFVL